MANWDKLNPAFDNLINSISDEEFKNWAENRAKKKAARQQELVKRSKVQEDKISIVAECYVDLEQIGLKSSGDGIHCPPPKHSAYKMNQDSAKAESSFLLKLVA